MIEYEEEKIINDIETEIEIENIISKKMDERRSEVYKKYTLLNKICLIISILIPVLGLIGFFSLQQRLEDYVMFIFALTLFTVWLPIALFDKLKKRQLDKDSVYRHLLLNLTTQNKKVEDLLESATKIKFQDKIYNKLKFLKELNKDKYSCWFYKYIIKNEKNNVQLKEDLKDVVETLTDEQHAINENLLKRKIEFKKEDVKNKKGETIVFFFLTFLMFYPGVIVVLYKLLALIMPENLIDTYFNHPIIYGLLLAPVSWVTYKASKLLTKIANLFDEESDNKINALKNKEIKNNVEIEKILNILKEKDIQKMFIKNMKDLTQKYEKQYSSEFIKYFNHKMVSIDNNKNYFNEFYLLQIIESKDINALSNIRTLFNEEEIKECIEDTYKDYIENVANIYDVKKYNNFI